MFTSPPFAVVCQDIPVLSQLPHIIQQGPESWIVDIPRSAELLPDIVVFLTQQLPTDAGISVYWSCPDLPVGGMQYMFSLTNLIPSKIQHTSWPLNDELRGKHIRLGLALESKDVISTKVLQGLDSAQLGQVLKTKKTLAKNVALNLYW